MKELINHIIEDTINAIDEYERKIDEINRKQTKKNLYLTISLITVLALLASVLTIVLYNQL